MKKLLFFQVQRWQITLILQNFYSIFFEKIQKKLKKQGVNAQKGTEKAVKMNNER